MASAELAAECNNSSVVHVCTFNIRHYADRLEHMRGWLSLEEQVRAQRFLKEADRMRFVLGRAIVRSLCGAHLRIEPARIRLDHTSTGKPYLANPILAGRKRFEFNVAHSGDCVLVAWTEGRAVGVDVEALERYRSDRIKDISATAFSTAERVALSAAKPDEVITTFYRIWVRKEAILKAEGCGIGGSLRSFSVAQRQVSCIKWCDEVTYPESGRRWRSIDWIPAPDHLAALALPQGSVVHQCTPQNIYPQVREGC
jgi:4'-phosphopantetheinyl transferase